LSNGEGEPAGHWEPCCCYRRRSRQSQSLERKTEGEETGRTQESDEKPDHAAERVSQSDERLDVAAERAQESEQELDEEKTVRLWSGSRAV
jgi:hypothetical protein